MPHSSSLILYNAHIHTLDPDRPHASALVVVDGRIVAIGDHTVIHAYQDKAPNVLDAQGATVIPGFIDTHVHFTITGLGLLAVDVFGADSMAEVLERIATGAAERPVDGLVVASKFQPELLPEARFPTPLELDAAAAGRPVYVMEAGGHWSAVNQAALALLDLHDSIPGQQFDESGQFNGILSDEANTVAFTKLWQRYSDAIGVERAFDEAAAEAVRGGVTTLHALDDMQDIRALLSYGDRLPVRVVPYTQSKDVAAVKALGVGQIGGCGQVMVNGDFGPHTAALLEPYDDDPSTTGKLYYSDAELDAYVLESHLAGLQVGLHCVGSAAVEQLLNAYEAALTRHPRPDHRHRIEHFELPAPGQAERAKRLGLILAMQPSFNHFWPHHSEYPEVVGEERALRVDPVKSVLDAGLHVAYGSDSPVTPMNSLLWMHSAVNHSNPAERISAERALRLCTETGSWFSFEEQDKGTLAVGKLGDFVLLDSDPLATPSQKIKDIGVLKTVVGGLVVYGS
ncbi:MAG: amidohydrolase [Chloroflexi bacterium]|nr:amidohydrolase [Chloroflexota bacterium]